MSAHWKSWPDVDSTAHACATHILSMLEMALAGDGPATLALSGGSSPKIMFGHLVRANFDWSRVHVFWVDERSVPPTHADSNLRSIDSAWDTDGGPGTATITAKGLMIEIDLRSVDRAFSGTLKLHYKRTIPDEVLHKLPTTELAFPVVPTFVYRAAGVRPKP